MDINSSQSPFSRAKSYYSKLTSKVKITIGCVLLVLFYYFFFYSSGNKNDEDTFVPSFPDMPNAGSGGGSEKVHSISMSYLELKKPFLDLNTLQFYNYINGGNMQLEREAEYVRLVPDRPSSVGYLFSRNVISDQDSSALELELSFKLHGAQKRSNLIGDGMAIWITDSQLSRGDVFGMQGDFNGLGIFLDTYRNADRKQYRNSNKNRFPYLSLQSNHGDPAKYNKDNDGFETELAGCSLSNIYNAGSDNSISRIRILYLRKSKYFQIDVDVYGDDNWSTCVQKADFPDDVIPMTPFIGISAETGELSQAVDIYRIKAWTFRTEDGKEVTSKEELIAEAGMKDNEVLKKKDFEYGTQRLGGNKAQHRRTLKRLQRQERDLKRKEAEKYGDPNGFIGWFGKLLWKIVKTVLYILLTMILAYFCLIAYRVYRDKRKNRRHEGLL
ncbi:DEKNAAC103992 [Brettanomyces naardenensis]|uniref:DEKNAAC103992 n=1 Tax=Brettanomyces naardenensis TaxID=13370 RepID=A0A448YQ18_BRENA|nr:DEKNAAC103992 [Brettanomyces naardenensis]